eukprot:TRINITY_DN7192_c0_g1_i2.p1 TRINITY_DN7192_c0_g1~~TRINITY_DN7192_c0_g1_i2.p1  ORF type:complete len:602 (+),score=146.62 TRINITY_DN7192_c0_g1_i2:110-1915(+)
MDVLAQSVSNVAHMLHLVDGDDHPSLSISEVEEVERERRLNSSLSQNEKIAAWHIGALMKANNENTQQFKGYSYGYKRFTNKIEEEERSRRIVSRFESNQRRLNANRAARMIHSLGWPFMEQGLIGKNLYVAHTTQMEEEERERRYNDVIASELARMHASKHAKMIMGEHMANPHPLRSGNKQYTVYLENHERARRLRDEAGMEYARSQAYEVSGMIRELGWPFYMPNKFNEVEKNVEQGQSFIGTIVDKALGTATSTAKKIFGMIHLPSWNHAQQQYGDHIADVASMEAAERQCRLEPAFQKLAKQQSRAVAKLINEDTVKSLHKPTSIQLENRERSLRLRDARGSRRARHVARHVSRMVIQHVKEEANKAKQEEEELEETARHNAHAVANMFMDRRQSLHLRDMIEYERHRRLTDTIKERRYRKGANELAALVSKTTEFKMRYRQVEYDHKLRMLYRTSNMADWMVQQISIINANKYGVYESASGDVYNIPSDEDDIDAPTSESGSHLLIKFPNNMPDVVPALEPSPLVDTTTTITTTTTTNILSNSLPTIYNNDIISYEEMAAAPAVITIAPVDETMTKMDQAALAPSTRTTVGYPSM